MAGTLGPPPSRFYVDPATIASSLASFPTEAAEAAAGVPGGVLVAGAALALLTALLVGLSVPGTLMPLSFTGGTLLGPVGIAVIALGAVVGSQVLFIVSRHFLADSMRRRLGKRLENFEGHLAKHGPLYVVGSRVIGVPHVVVTGGSALTPMSARAFALASLVGMLPAITLAVMAGSAL